MSQKATAQLDKNARRKSERAEILTALEQAHREELERIHLQHAEEIRQVEAERIEIERKLNQQKGFYADLADQYKREAKQWTAELLEAKDLLLRAAEERAKIERRFLHEAIQMLREQHEQQGKVSTTISRSNSGMADHTGKPAVQAPQSGKGAVLPTGLDPISLSVGVNAMTAEEKTLFEVRLERAIKTGGVQALITLLENQIAGRSPQFVAFWRLKAASVALASGHVVDATRMADIALKNSPVAFAVRGAVSACDKAPVARLGALPEGKLTIACIMDDFTLSSYQPEAVLHQLTPANWKAELEASNPDLLFIESAWRGKDELWGNKVGHTSAELQGIVAWCRTKHL
ncbi:MAG: hypothetical protein HXY51_07755, partial [Nitrospirae bacterium]|nr:hypothetical protein [Nitrospirota bacterium]